MVAHCSCVCADQDALMPLRYEVVSNRSHVVKGKMLCLHDSVRTSYECEEDLFDAHCNTLQHTATHCNTLRHIATHWNTLQLAPTGCNTMQHTAAHCDTL